MNQLQKGGAFKWAHDYVKDQSRLKDAHRIFKVKALQGPKYTFGVMVPQNPYQVMRLAVFVWVRPKSHCWIVVRCQLSMGFVVLSNWL